jgi:hypothetical protein
VPGPDPAQTTGAIARFMALRTFRTRLYRCFTARADALSELTDAILCADHAVTSLVQLSLLPEFTRGHGALYDALAGGGIDEEALAQLLTGTLAPLADGEQARAWIGEHNVIDYGLLESALAGLPDEDAGAVREACARWTRLRFAIDATPTRGRTPTAPRSVSTSIMMRAGATGPARPSSGGSTSSSPRPGICAPRGPRSSTWSAPRRRPAPARPPGR